MMRINRKRDDLNEITFLCKNNNETLLQFYIYRYNCYIFINILNIDSLRSLSWYIKIINLELSLKIIKWPTNGFYIQRHKLFTFCIKYIIHIYYLLYYITVICTNFQCNSTWGVEVLCTTDTYIHVISAALRKSDYSLIFFKFCFLFLIKPVCQLN